MNITIYTVASKEHGLGHVKRMLVLARELTARGIGVTFATEHETLGADIIAAAGFDVLDYSPGDHSWADRPADVCLIDLEHGPERAMLEAVRLGRGGKVIVVAGSGYVLTDRVAVDELADLIICQSIMPTRAEKADVLSGVEYMLIDPAYAALTPNLDGPIVVAMGGTDPHGLTPKVVKALKGISREMLALNGNADSIKAALDGAALLIGALGMTAYEAAAAGVPMLLSNWTEDHHTTTLELVQRGVAIDLGVWDKFNGQTMAVMVNELFAAKQTWQLMSKAGKQLVDGQGVRRVADAIIELIEPEKVQDEA